ncbi:MAG: hypothetical protein LBB53_01045 [Prevotellaceae bacterium]|jgi:hypothetical protein|nr:hypothetical protein [Prevotellaceae bacterium]
MNIQSNDQTDGNLTSPNSFFKADEEYIQADLFVRMAHTTAKRTYWAISASIVILITIFIMGFNQYWSYGHINSKELFKNNIELSRKLKLASDSLKLDSILGKNQNNYYSVLNLDDSVISKIEEIRKTDKYFYPTKTTFKDTIENLQFRENYARTARREYIRNYEDSYFITVPLLGSKINADDAPFLFGLTLLILLIWVYVCVKNENLTIGKILNLTADKTINIKRYIFYGIAFNNFIFPNTQRKNSYFELSDKKPNDLEDAIYSYKKKKEVYWLLNIVRKIIKFAIQYIMYLCVFLFFVYCMWDLAVLLGIEYTKGFVEYETDFSILRIINGSSPTYTYWVWQLIVAFIMILFMLPMAVLIHKTQNATKEILNDYKRRFKHDEQCKNGIAGLPKGEYELTVASIEEKNIFINNCNDSFIETYSKENGYLFLCHSGKLDEVIRLIKLLTGNKPFKKNIKISFLPTNFEKTFNCEYFLFLRPTFHLAQV